MATQRQIEANRRNAQKSTGPRSPEGKAVSRLNALKCGIDAEMHVVPGEDSEALEELALEYHGRFRPASPEQRLLVDAMIHAEWLLRRFRRVEAEMWKHRLKDAYHLDRKNALGDIYGRSLEAFNRLQRRVDSAERTWRRSLAELRRLQAEPSPSPEPPQPAPTVSGSGTREEGPEPPTHPASEVPETQLLTPEIGFVPPKPVRRISDVCNAGVYRMAA